MCSRDDESPLSSSQIAEQIDVIQEVVLPAVAKLNDSAINKEKGDQTQFSPNTVTTLEMVGLLPIMFFLIKPVD